MDAEEIKVGAIAFSENQFWKCIEKRNDNQVVYLRFQNLTTFEKKSNWYAKNVPTKFQILEFPPLDRLTKNK